MEQQYDVVVVGGGAAGLSGALALSRARRSVLVVDDGAPRNAPAGHVHNYLGREGTPPGELLTAGRREAAGYGAEFLAGEATGARPVDDGFVVDLCNGSSVRGRRLLVTTGLVDELPDVPGVRELWGRDVLHCPYCHGWEVRDQPVGVLSTGPLGVHGALLWRQWSADVTLFQHTGPAPTDEEREQLSARGISVVPGEVAGLVTAGDRLSGVRLVSGQVVPRAALVVAPRFTARSGLLDALGLPAVDQEMAGHVFGSAVPSDPWGATAVPGVWVAGNVTDLRAQVISSAAAGLNTAAAINADLIAEDTRRAVADRAGQHGHGTAHRHACTAQDAAAWDERYLSSPSVWSGRPNAALVAEVADLPPGRALDLGSGEGGDAVWLASRGWRVTGVDWSPTALQRAAVHAAEAGVGDRVEWVTADLTTWTPPAGAFDLIAAAFLHPTAAERAALLARLASALAPGGALVWVGHDYTEERAVWGADRFADVDDVVADLPGDWEVLVAEQRPREARGHEGGAPPLVDVVVRARRR
ncbi:methyltransferase domain-containing protein [Geodermatophilus ruber]|uniref:Thioredoxin reductase n=1 Tax=Geodermatophilus ruber TaxID=504800 RepID=A0A1I4K169_9ACTN|nr:methyltransferase domain-containing protein [Geodermatophilus ruber]SFL72096.1 Thioredoxin reductase [Geodermatophilus ruber]